MPAWHPWVNVEFEVDDTDPIPLEIDLRGGYDGVPGQRSPDAECEMYLIGERQPCFGDGHYLCKECQHFSHRITEEECADRGHDWAPVTAVRNIHLGGEEVIAYDECQDCGARTKAKSIEYRD